MLMIKLQRVTYRVIVDHSQFWTKPHKLERLRDKAQWVKVKGRTTGKRDERHILSATCNEIGQLTIGPRGVSCQGNSLMR